MVKDNRERIRMGVLATAELAGRTLSDSAVKLYVHELAHLPIEAVCAALIKGGRAQRLPSVDEIEAAATGRQHANEAAVEAADLIAKAIKDVGRYNPKRAQEQMGELAWAVVMRNGSWESVCEVADDRALEIAKAHWRETAKSIANRARAGTLGQMPALPAPDTPRGLTTAGNLLAGLLPPR